MPLEHGIGVRVPDRQQMKKARMRFFHLLPVASQLLGSRQGREDLEHIAKNPCECRDSLRCEKCTGHVMTESLLIKKTTPKDRLCFSFSLLLVHYPVHLPAGKIFH